MIFGSDTNSQRYVRYEGGSIGAPVFSVAADQKFIYRWDVGTFFSPLSAIKFEYAYFQEKATPENSYVREGYIKNIKWIVNGQEIERHEFKTRDKLSSEYAGYWHNEPKLDQRIFETRRLDTLKCYKEGSLVYTYIFDYIVQPKALLSGIRIQYPYPVSASVKQDSAWAFTYDATRFLLLNSVITPSSRKDSIIYTKFNFASTAGAQDTNNYVMMRSDNATEVALPASPADRALWSVENTCDERFCYAVVRDGDSQTLPGESFSKKVYVEVKRNTGNYFDPRATADGEKATLRLEMGDPSSQENDWKVYPMGDYLLAVGEKSGTVDMWEYDGIKWVGRSPFSGDSHWNGSFGSAIRVYPSSNYFVVQKIGIPSVLIVALRTPTGWTSLNRLTCQFSNKDSYGDPIRASQTGSECLEWSNSDLIVTAAQNFFSVLYGPNDVFCIFALNRAGSGFTDISDLIWSVAEPTSLQKILYPMNWEQNVVSVTSSGRNLFIQSTGSSPWLHGFYFDGQSMVSIMEHSFPGSGAVSVFPSEDYLVVAEPRGASGTIDYFPRRTRTGGEPYFESADKKIARSDWNSAWKLQVKTHPKAFSVTYYPNDASVGLRPKWEASPSTNYRSYLYHVNREFTDGFADRTGQLQVPGSGGKFFNFSFSGSDDVLTATSATTSGNGLCNENPDIWPCNINMYSFRFRPENTTTFISNGAGDLGTFVFNNTWASQKQSQKILSNCARLMTGMILDTVGGIGRIRYRHYQYEGKGYSTPDSIFVVTDMISRASLTDEDKNRIRQKIWYAPTGNGSESPPGVAEFNSNLQVPQFEFAEVAQRNSSGISLGFTRTYFNVDSYANNMTGKSLPLRGTRKMGGELRNDGSWKHFTQTSNEEYHNPAWPSTLFANRVRSIVSYWMAQETGSMADTTYYLGYCDTNGAPRFNLQTSRPEKTILTQNIFDAKGLTTQAMTFKLSSLPDTAALRTWPNATSYGTNPVSAAKTVYDGYYFLRDSVWVEKDQTLTDADLRSGRTPVFNFSEGWLPAREITQRDVLSSQVLEMKVRKNSVSGAQGEIHTSTFYEGLRFNPVAVVSNAKRSDCAVLMAENGNVGFSGARLDYPSKWENSGGSFSTDRSHTGRYSIKVVDGFGPVINLYLKDVRALGYDFKISAWIYSLSVTPVVSLDRFQSNGAYLDGIAGIPVSGSMSAGKWQRWEARLSYAQLTAGNRFNGNNDYVRMTFGTGSPTGSSSRIVYVDDIVCIPSTADFSLSTYDKGGTPTSVTGGNFLPTYYDLGFRGNVMAVRDEHYRIFSQNAVHKMGEN